MVMTSSRRRVEQDASVLRLHFPIYTRFKEPETSKERKNVNPIFGPLCLW